MARQSYIDPRVIEVYERGEVIELPADKAGDAAREEVERRVRALLAA